MKRYRWTALLLVLFLPLTMASKGCSTAGHTTATVPVYVGGGAPAVIGAPTGTWLHVGDVGNAAKWALWATVAAGGAKAGYTFAATVARSHPYASKGSRIANAMVNNPCRDENGTPRGRFYKIARWVSSLPTNRWTNPKNANPILDCTGFYNILGNGSTPGRLKHMYDCIANIIAAGAKLGMDSHKASWAWNGGWVVAKDGRVLEAKPAGKGWGDCARMTP